MKNQLNKFLFILTCSYCSYFQTTAQASFGLVGGISHTWSLDVKSSGFTSPGFTFGVKTRIPLAEHIHFQPELLLVNQKTGYSISSNSFNNKSSTTIFSQVIMIEIPLWVQLGRNNHFGFGLSYGFPFSSSSSSSITTTTQSPSKTTTENFSSKSKNLPQVSFGISYSNAVNTIGWEVKPKLIFVRESLYGNGEDGLSALFNLSLVVSWNKNN